MSDFISVRDFANRVRVGNGQWLLAGDLPSPRDHKRATWTIGSPLRWRDGLIKGKKCELCSRFLERRSGGRGGQEAGQRALVLAGGGGKVAARGWSCLVTFAADQNRIRGKKNPRPLRQNRWGIQKLLLFPEEFRTHRRFVRV